MFSHLPTLVYTFNPYSSLLLNLFLHTSSPLSFSCDSHSSISISFSTSSSSNRLFFFLSLSPKNNHLCLFFTFCFSHSSNSFSSASKQQLWYVGLRVAHWKATKQITSFWSHLDTGKGRFGPTTGTGGGEEYKWSACPGDILVEAPRCSRTRARTKNYALDKGLGDMSLSDAFCEPLSHLFAQGWRFYERRCTNRRYEETAVKGWRW